MGKVAKVASLFRSLLSPAKEKVPDLNDQEAEYSYINEVTRNPLSRKLLLEYASDEVRAGVVECEGRYRFNIRIHEGRDNLKGYYRLAKTDPEMYKILLHSERVPLGVRNILKVVQDENVPGSSSGALMIKVIVVPERPASLNEKYEGPLSAGPNAPDFNDEGAAGGCKPLGKYDVEGSYEGKLQIAIKESLR